MSVKRLTNFLVPIFTFSILLLISFFHIFLTPKLGFSIKIPSYIISDIDMDFSVSIETLQEDDRIVSLNGTPVEAWEGKFLGNPFYGHTPGDILHFTADRDGQEIDVDWEVPGFHPLLLAERIKVNLWWVIYPFWFVGTLTLAFVQPSDYKKRLLVAFNYLTAFWLAIGSSISGYQMFYGTEILKILLWISVPVYWQLHLNFPGKLINIPKRIWTIIYAVFIFLAVLEVFRVFPRSSMYISALLAVGGMLILILLQGLFNKKSRRQLRFLAFSVFISISFIILVEVIPHIFNLASSPIGGGVLAMPLIPLAYFFTLFRHRLGNIELRANRAVTIYLFILLLSIPLIILVPLFNTVLEISPLFTTAILTFSGILLAIWLFRPFTRFVESKIMGITIPPEHLLPVLNSRITTTFSYETLDRLLINELLPSLLIRQSMLLLRNNAGYTKVSSLGDNLSQPEPVFLESLPPDQPAIRLPDDQYRDAPEWLLLALPLRFENELIGWWLLGRRDPEDLYSQADQQYLRALADSISSAIRNVQQKDQLRQLYEINITRQENEKESLARNLHDLVLNQLAVMFIQMEDEAVTPQFEAEYQQLTTNLRQTIQDLRPPTLSLGLNTALKELCEDLELRAPSLEISLDIQQEPVEFPARFETQIFRIIQQGCENVLKHAEASSLKLHGSIHQNRIHLEICDNGKGFEIKEAFELSDLLQHNHFGLAHMYERAELIEAELSIHSEPGKGTCVMLHWEK